MGSSGLHTVLLLVGECPLVSIALGTAHRDNELELSLFLRLGNRIKRNLLEVAGEVRGRASAPVVGNSTSVLLKANPSHVF